MYLAGKLRVGVIGCGDMSRNHIYGYLNSARFEIVALADISEAAMRDFDERFAPAPPLGIAYPVGAFPPFVTFATTTHPSMGGYAR